MKGGAGVAALEDDPYNEHPREIIRETSPRALDNPGAFIEDEPEQFTP
jgi:hypothetical protein